MIEAGADEVPEDIMLDAIKKGHEEIKRIIEFIEGIVKEIGKEKFEYISAAVPQDILTRCQSLRTNLQAMMNDDKKNAIKCKCSAKESP